MLITFTGKGSFQGKHCIGDIKQTTTYLIHFVFKLKYNLFLSECVFVRFLQYYIKEYPSLFTVIAVLIGWLWIMTYSILIV